MNIKEMAEKEFPIKSWDEHFAANDCRRIYCMGANAVLKEIEFLFKHCRDYQLYHLLDLKIKELKGI